MAMLLGWRTVGYPDQKSMWMWDRVWYKCRSRLAWIYFISESCSGKFVVVYEWLDCVIWFFLTPLFSSAVLERWLWDLFVVSCFFRCVGILATSQIWSCYWINVMSRPWLLKKSHSGWRQCVRLIRRLFWRLSIWLSRFGRNMKVLRIPSAVPWLAACPLIRVRV